MLEIIQYHTGNSLQEVRQLFQEYAKALGISLGFQDFDEEVATLPGSHVPPKGRLLLAFWNGQRAGCGV